MPKIALPELSYAGGDRSLLEGFLGHHRSYLRHKCVGLTGDQLAVRSVSPSNLSLLGLLRHLARVERLWFRERIGRQKLEPIYGRGRDLDFRDLDPTQARADYERLVDEVRLAEVALAAASWDDMIKVGSMGQMSVRAVVVHMIAEYAQHNGHADLLRESIDGITEK